MKTIYLAGGCFWGMEKALQQLDGVKETTTGYANGNVANPTYQLVCTDTTEFRETVKVEYDPAEIHHDPHYTDDTYDLYWYLQLIDRETDNEVQEAS